MEKTNYIINYFIKENEAKFSQETVRGYTISLKQFFAFCQKEYDAVKTADIRDWLIELNSAGLKPRSISLKLASLRSFYRRLIENELISKNPTLDINSPKIEDYLPVYLGKADLVQLMEAAKDHTRDRAVLETLYATGVRASELLNIRLEDIKWDIRQIWIRKGKGNKERFVLFTAECAERLKHYLANRQIESPYLFANRWGNPFSRVWLEKRLSRYAIGFNSRYKITPHTLRHTFAAHLSQKDMPQAHIQELLGHININTTKIYTRLQSIARKKQYDSYQ
ncbi:MAG: integrase [Peptococcaceae bacterium BICA1-7]|nr:MAG: integrase [Peptococcaceae bacterium BICA1-7]HBV96176.1 integrase [Desulfotomaculum sp.]